MADHQLDPRNLPKDRLTTTDEIGNRMYIYPADVKGPWVNRRFVFQWVLVFFFLLAPWIKISGQPLVLLDIAHRHFVLFGVQFWAHDGPLVFFLLGGFAFSLALVTAVLGRVWCGWACPQTVFIERVFRRIERWIEGEALTRKKRDQSPGTWDWYWRKVAKWSLFLGAALVMTHSFLAYFVGAGNVLSMVQGSPADHPTAFLIVLVATAVVLFDFGWFREQFCLIACPYGRFQSVLMDKNSMLVGYDTKRGEPRGKGNAGDCIDCYRCVQVCPTGIDIRKGLQLECIACTACMDACDTVMDKIGKPQGLIRYASLQELEVGGPKFWNWKAVWRPRVGLYGAILFLFFSGLTYLLSYRVPIDQTWIRAVGAPFEQGADGFVTNRFRVDVTNQAMGASRVDFWPESLVSGTPTGSGSAPGLAGVQVVRAQADVRLDPGARQMWTVFVRFPASLLKEGAAQIRVGMKARDDRGVEWVDFQNVQLVGPISQNPPAAEKP